MLELYGLYTGGIDYGNRPHVVAPYSENEFFGRMLRKYGYDGDDTQPLEVDTYTIERDNLIILKREVEFADLDYKFDYFILRNFIKAIPPVIRIYDYDYFIVDRVEKRSGKIYYYCHKDKWAYGQHKLFESMLHVTKSNKHLTYGVFDDIKLLTATKFIENLQTYSDNFNPQYLKPDNVLVVFKVQYKTAVTSFESTEATGLFAISPRALRNALIQLVGTSHADTIEYLNNLNALFLTSDYISAIYALKARNNWTDLEAKVLKAWVVDSRLLETNFRNLTFVTNGNLTLWGSFQPSTPAWTLEATQVAPMRKELTITRPQFSALSNREFLGTEENNLELTRYVDAYQAKITCITSNDDLEINVECGNEKINVTEAFSIPIVTGTSTSAEEKVSQMLSYYSNVVTSSKNIAKGGLGGYAGLAINTTKETLDTLKTLFDWNASHNNIGGSVGGGDGLKNFVAQPWNPSGQSTDYEFLNPYKVVKFASPALTQLRHAGLEGVNYDLFMKLHDILDASLLEQDIITSEGASISPITYRTYLKVDNLNLDFDDQQSEVYEFIQNELLRGVYLIDITNA